MPCKEDIGAIKKDIDLLEGSTREQVNKKISKVVNDPDIGDHKHGWPVDIRVVPVLNHRYVLAYRFTREPECLVTFILLLPHDELYQKMDKMYKRK